MLKNIAAATRNAHLWLPEYLASRRRHLRSPAPQRVWVAIADHFEPLWQGPDDATAAARVARWRRAWAVIAGRYRDSRGEPPRYTFFYPEEEYRPWLLEPLAEMTRLGVGDVEVHLHHDNDTRAAFTERVTRFLEALSENHGLLRRRAGKLAFGFIHGNWALDNARPDGRWCGLDDEISLLRDLGCYADFTMPAAPNVSQDGPVNAIYRVTDDPRRPRSFARGTLVAPGAWPKGDLTMIGGPLAVRLDGRRLLPRLDTGELAHHNPPSRERVESWLDVAPRVGSDVFVKLFAHGAQEKNAHVLLEGGLDVLFGALSSACVARDCELRYVSAWQMCSRIEELCQASSSPW